jgi:hypothetical protein
MRVVRLLREEDTYSSTEPSLRLARALLLVLGHLHAFECIAALFVEACHMDTNGAGRIVNILSRFMDSSCDARQTYLD